MCSVYFTRKYCPRKWIFHNKYILEIHGHSLKEDTIEALKVVKDAILHYPSLLDALVTKEMLRSVKASSQRY